MRYIYQVLYAAAFLAMVPYFLYLYLVRHKSINLRKRFHCPMDRIFQGDCLLVHAVSVGETQAIAPLVYKLMKENPQRQVIITNCTETGHCHAEKLFPQAICLFLPFDFSFSVRCFLSGLSPKLMLISEGDLWPEFLYQLKRRNVPVVVVNGSVSDRTYRRLCMIPSIARQRFQHVDLFCLQNDLFAQRLRYLGVRSDRIVVTGSLKADATGPLLSVEEKESLRVRLGLHSNDRVIVMASTHDPEENILCNELYSIVQKDSHWKILVAPRHPERFMHVYKMLSAYFPKTSLYSRHQANWKILVVDAMGLLTKLYQIADVAIVAGSFVESVGGHNIVEPALANIPVIVGPYMHSQKALIESARKHEAVIEVDRHGLGGKVLALLEDPIAYKEAQVRIRAWVADVQGATQRTLNCIHLLSRMG